jgi:DNA-directed RNA polymerase subunit N (RpoN/RPB10)
MDILHYCKFCGYTGIASKYKDVLYCSRCQRGDKIETIYKDLGEEEAPITDVFDEFEIKESGKDIEMSLDDLTKLFEK